MQHIQWGHFDVLHGKHGTSKWEHFAGEVNIEFYSLYIRALLSFKMTPSFIKIEQGVHILQLKKD